MVVQCPQCGHRFSPADGTQRVTESVAAPEALVNGKPSWDDIRELVRKALRARVGSEYSGYLWVGIVDLTDTDVVYLDEGDQLHQCSYVVDGEQVTLGDPVKVVRSYEPAAANAVERAQIDTTARVVEAKGTDDEGNRVFRVRIIAYGVSRNRRRYTESVLRAAADLYDGAKAYDHHRTAEEMASGTIAGLVGWYSDVEATSEGLEADLHLLPSATHAAEALDASLAAQESGGEPLVGISHDAQAQFRAITENGQTLQDCAAIIAVNSADIVAHPAAGGKATRVVAGGIADPDSTGTEPASESTKEPDVTVTRADVLAAFKEASDEELAAAGLARAGTKTTETEKPTGKPEPVTETETAFGKAEFLGRTLIRSKVDDASLPASFVEAVTSALPDRFTEAAVDAQIAAVKAALGVVERAGLEPAGMVTVTKEAHEKKVAAVDAMFAGDFRTGYHSFREAFLDFTGHRLRSWDVDLNKLVLRESIGAASFDSGDRVHESLDSTSWAQVLGDSVTRSMIAAYGLQGLDAWRRIVSKITPVNDFRTQRRMRWGGYGTLPTVAEGGTYQPLTSPGDEEATYAPTKRGGTEDLTFEMIANDDMAQIIDIPRKLGRAAAQTLYRFVFDTLVTNAATTYDSTALFHANHGNTTAVALSNSGLTTLRQKMRDQAAYGDSSEVLGAIPKLLIVPNELEETAKQVTGSPGAVPANTNDPNDRPNLHQGLDYLVLDYWTDANDWMLVADPAMVPTIEVGFYRGREDPELFTQSEPTVGSVFARDVLTFKIRHIYGEVVLDHRGFQRGTQ